MESGIAFTENDAKKLRDLPVSALVLFGSRAEGIAKEDSDYDVAVLVSDYAALRDRKRRAGVYDALYDILSGLINKLADIDIVFLPEAPAELKAHVVKYGQLIYGDAAAFASFKEREMLNYADFAPLREIFQKATLARIGS